MEFIDIYDDLGQKSGKSEDKDEAHRKALIHRGVCVWIMNSKREILLQTRSSHVMFPDMLDISFSGHIQTGETPLEAVKREGREELGVNIDASKLQYLFSCREYGGDDGYFENEIDDVFLYDKSKRAQRRKICATLFFRLPYPSTSHDDRRRT
ncbi:MAG: NUDIX domain-containing protein [Lachnospiraceae bacterium]|nr:NUDIX domain-containing protein [Lachnospiraceae bacterium]